MDHQRRRVGLALIAPALGMLMPPAAAQAPGVPAPVTVAGVRYEGHETLADARLLLNGAGIRYKAVFRVYTAGLYLTQPAATPEAVYALPGPKRLHIVMLRDIDANELGKLFTQGMEANAPREIFSRSIPGTLRLAELFARKKRLAGGDSFTVDFVPGRGTVVVVNGVTETEPVREPEFFQALMSIWLGRAPADESLKRALLGQAASGRPER